MRETRLSDRPDAWRVHFVGAIAPRTDSVADSESSDARVR
jgi:hypothetical protein